MEYEGVCLYIKIWAEIVNKEAWMYKIQNSERVSIFLANKRTIHIEKE